MTVKELSTVPNISWETVRNQLKYIYDKLHIHSRTEAVLKYLGRTPVGPAS
jgi:DNA-binding NarL/FixJ family response regulator